MKFYTFVIFSLFLSISYCQSNDDFWQSKVVAGQENLKDSDYQGAKSEFSSALNYAKTTFGNNASEVGTAYFFLGKTEAISGNIEKSVESFKKALENMLQNEIHQHPYYYTVFEELVPIYKKYDQFLVMEAAMVNSIPIIKSKSLTSKEEREIIELVTKGFILQMDNMSGCEGFYWNAWHAFRDSAIENNSDVEDNSNLFEKIQILLSTQPSYFIELEDENPYEDLEIWEALAKKYGKEFILTRKLEVYKLLENNFGPQYGAAMFNFQSLDQIANLEERILNELGNTHPLYIETLNFIGKILNRLADYSNAHNYFEKAFLIIQDNKSATYQVYPELLSNYASVLVKLGKYEDAENLFFDSMESFENRRFTGNKTFNISNTNNLNRVRLNLGIYYKEIGDFKNAEEILKKALFSQDTLLQPFQKWFNDATFNEVVPEVPEGINKSYILQKRIGNELLNLFSETSVSEDLNIEFISSEEVCYWNLTYYGKINLRLFITCPGEYYEGSPKWGLGINENDQDFNNSIFKFTLNNDLEHLQLYSNYLKIALFDYPPSLKPYVISIGDERNSRERRENKTAKDTLGDLRYGNYIKDFADVLYLGENYTEAISNYDHYKKILDFNYGNDHQNYSILYKKLAKANLQLGRLDEASDYLSKSNRNFLGQIEEIFRFGNTNEKKNFISKLTKNFSDFQQIEMKYPSLPNITEMNLNNQLVLKGLLLNSSKDILIQLASLEEPPVDSLIRNYRETRDILSAEYAIPKPSRTKNTDSLENIKKDIERQPVKAYSKNFGSSINYQKEWKEVREKLQENEISIEFSSVKIKDSIDNPVIYNAYLFRKKWAEPVMITLFEESDFKKIVSGNSPNTLYKSRGSTARSTQNNSGLYELIWKKIDPYLSGVKTVYFSPSGLLNQVSFAALGEKNGKILSSRYNLVQLNSTLSLLEEQLEPEMNNTLMIGGVNYDYKIKSVENNINKNNLLNLESLSRSKSNNEIGTAWNYLPGTLAEVIAINDLFNELNISSTLLTYNDASEEAFKNLSGRNFEVIHIATHGFFFENLKDGDKTILDSSKNIYKSSEDPLLRSGLIFSGANYTWLNGNKTNQKEDGILTALEISNLDLSNTKIVVLSACETGLGDIDGSEGVYGLQRAFKMAGVEIIIMSLWEVPDKETAEFMNLFYKNWIDGGKVRKAFQRTQRTMSERYKDSPEKWAAFVMFE